MTGVNDNMDYMAPEVTNQEKYYHLKSDVYSFGIIMNNLFFNQKCLMIQNKKDG